MTSSFTPASAAPPVRSRRTMIAWISGSIAVVGLSALGVFFANVYWPYRYRNVEPLLENVFASKIKMDHYRRTYFPHPGFVASGLTLRRNNAPDLPPVGSAEELHVQGEWNDLLMLHRSVPLVYVKGLHIVIPPVGSRANQEEFPPGSSMDFAGPTTAVETLQLRDAELDILRTNGGRYRFPIRDLTIHNLQRGKTITYSVDMENAMPHGRIQSQGSFGPLKPENLGKTALSGRFTFDGVALKDFGGIGGVLSSFGSFQGTIASIEAGARATVPEFAVGRGRPVTLAGSVRGVVNGLNADVVLEEIEATTGATTVKARGQVVALTKNAPKTTDLDLEVNGGQAKDLLRPFLTGQVPIIGAVSLKSHAHVAPAAKGVSFLQRLTMEGALDVPAERLTDRKTEKTLSSFSGRAQGAKTGDAEADVLSSVRGQVRVRDGVVSTERLTFLVPGAEANLNGTFDLKSAGVHMTGDLAMKSDVSHVTTGWKSFLLKPLIPFFKGKNAGAVIPIAITGRPGGYKVSQNVLHRK